MQTIEVKKKTGLESGWDWLTTTTTNYIVFDRLQKKKKTIEVNIKPSEYKAALEKQEQLKNSVSRLQEDLQNAQIFDLEEASDGEISFGTRVALTNVETSDTEEYVILGPWESDPGRNIISYLSPLGAELWSHRRNDELQFSINEKSFHYRIDKIDKIGTFQPEEVAAAT